MSDDFVIIFEKYIQIIISFLESMNREEWNTLGIILLISFIIIIIFGMTNRIVIFYNGMDLFWTVSIFLIYTKDKNHHNFSIFIKNTK